jgi:hypothetical protein
MIRGHISRLFDININDLDILVRFIRLVRLHVLYRVHRLQPRKKAPKDRVLLVEPRRRIRGDEKLRSVRVRTRIRHAQGIRPTKKKEGGEFSGMKRANHNQPHQTITYRSCFKSSENSSSNSRSQILVPPVPSPSGSPV